MVGLGLDVLDVLRVALGEVLDQLAERAKGARRKRLELADGALLRERLQPVELYADAITDERLLAEVDPERVHGPGVPAVERRQRGERRWHGLLLYGAWPSRCADCPFEPSAPMLWTAGSAVSRSSRARCFASVPA